MHPRSLFSLAERLSKDGDPLEVLAGTVEFERFRPLLVKGLGYRLLKSLQSGRGSLRA